MTLIEDATAELTQEHRDQLFWELRELERQDSLFLRSVLAPNHELLCLEAEIASEVNLALDELTYEQTGEDRSMDYWPDICPLCEHYKADVARGIVRYASYTLQRKLIVKRAQARHAAVKSEVGMALNLLTNHAPRKAQDSLLTALEDLTELDELLRELAKAR